MFYAETAAGDAFSLADQLRRADVVLVFVDPDCAPCHRMLPAVRDWQRRRARCRGSAGQSRWPSAQCRGRRWTPGSSRR